MLKSKKEKEPGGLAIRKVVASTIQKVLIEHWRTRHQEKNNKQVLEKCKGCNLDQMGESESCKRWCQRKELQGSVSRFIKKKEEFYLELDGEMINGIKESDSPRPSCSERLAEEVRCEDLDVELIRKQRISQELKDDLIRRNQTNHMRKESELIFYTDGSLRRSSTEEKPKIDRMGIGWVQVDDDEKVIIDEGRVGARNWPSSTKAELLAIWYVLLITPKRRKVKVYTDSAAAIASLAKIKRYKTSKNRIKEKNYDLKRSIKELYDLKEIELDLVKVKGHSDSRWNNRADILAKE